METNSASHEVFFDNFFTSFNLLVNLKEKGFYAPGTIRECRIKRCPLRSSKEMKKEEPATYDYRFDKQKWSCGDIEMQYAQWQPTMTQ